MKPQKAIITLTDNPDVPGNVKCEISFEPAVSAHKKTTPAIMMALDMIQHVTSQHKHTAPEVKS